MNREKRWIKAVQKHGNKHSANQLIEAYYKEIFAYVYKQMYDKETAKDVTQEIFISMLKSLYRYDGRSSFRTWLYMVAKSRVIDHYRSKQFKEATQGVSAEEEQIEDKSDFTERLATRAEAERALKLLESCAPEEERIVRMKLLGERTFPDISAETGLTLSTIKTKYYRTLKFVKKALKEEYWNE
ncbi:RNA polymerase sigma-70 factor, ECF subfamily [Halobacillus alkaliphilus]|uniref:RNA polymerase sigma-70 factor, ECF subfamily n=1 Tax=Halobacillus alkaliphilus TaxID=396056 RepID=A0A1I2N047_9BACI|nr:RNA polymerase sigma factor [Halobacillus alkaliphilus]SFF97235.1 RNA polymerase sigma-70 factor, ECF subfamily [Halobacillus alkaliphilus]